MDRDELSRAAANNHPMPDSLTLPDQWLYQTLRSLYGSFRNNLVSKEAAAEEKVQIVRQAEEADEKYRHYLDAVKHTAEAIRLSERYRADIHKGVAAGMSCSELFTLACECIAAITGDESMKKLRCK